MVPGEDAISSAMTGQSLFYMGESDLRTRNWRWLKKKARNAPLTP